MALMALAKCICTSSHQQRPHESLLLFLEWSFSAISASIMPQADKNGDSAYSGNMGALPITRG